MANLQRRLGEVEDDFRLKQKEMQLALEDSRTTETKIDSTRHNLELQMDGLNNEIAELKMKLSASEGRVIALEQHIARVCSFLKSFLTVDAMH